MRTKVTITLFTDTNTIPQAKDFMGVMLTRLAKDAVEFGVHPMKSGGPEGSFEVKVSDNRPKEKKVTETKSNLFSFSLTLDKYYDGKQITVIKMVREATGLSLKESKELVDRVRIDGPQLILRSADHGQAVIVKERFENAQVGVGMTINPA